MIVFLTLSALAAEPIESATGGVFAGVPLRLDMPARLGELRRSSLTLGAGSSAPLQGSAHLPIGNGVLGLSLVATEYHSGSREWNLQDNVELGDLATTLSLDGKAGVAWGDSPWGLALSWDYYGRSESLAGPASDPVLGDTVRPNNGAGATENGEIRGRHLDWSVVFGRDHVHPSGVIGWQIGVARHMELEHLDFTEGRVPPNDDRVIPLGTTQGLNRYGGPELEIPWVTSAYGYSQSYSSPVLPGDPSPATLGFDNERSTRALARLRIDRGPRLNPDWRIELGLDAGTLGLAQTEWEYRARATPSDPWITTTETWSRESGHTANVDLAVLRGTRGPGLRVRGGLLLDLGWQQITWTVDPDPVRAKSYRDQVAWGTLALPVGAAWNTESGWHAGVGLAGAVQGRISEGASGRDEITTDDVDWSFPIGYRTSLGAGWQHPTGWGLDAAWGFVGQLTPLTFPSIWLRWDPANQPWGHVPR